MNLLIHSAYLPPIEYFASICKADKVCIEICEHYIKQTYRNRCSIYGPNGMQLLVIPVTKPFGNKTLIKDVKISYNTKWQDNHWRSIQTAYNSSPYFQYYKDDLCGFYSDKFDLLIDFNTKLLQKLFELIGIQKQPVFTESYDKTPVNHKDLRYSENSQLTTLHYYTQVFNQKHGFIPNLSIIDLLFSEGPSAIDYLNRI